MDPLDTMKAINELWGKGLQNFFSAQQSAVGAMAPSVGETSIASIVSDAQAFRPLVRPMPKLGHPHRLISAALAEEGVKDGRGPGHRPDDVGHSEEIFDPKGWLSATSEVDRH